MGVVIIDYFHALEHRKKQFGVTGSGQRYVSIIVPNRTAFGEPQMNQTSYRVSLPFISIQHPELPFSHSSQLVQSSIGVPHDVGKISQELGKISQGRG